MSRPVLGTFLGAATFVIAPGLLADAVLPALGLKTLSRHCGEHPYIAALGLGVLYAHFEWHRLSRIWGRV